MRKNFLLRTIGSLLMMGVVAMTACQSNTAAAAADENSMLQLTPLKKGEKLAVLHTTMGDIKLRFFPEVAPKSVENFTKHAESGYYDGVSFHRIISDFMIQGGDPDGTGMGGESIWGGGFGVEFSLRVRHFRGALSMAHSSQPNSNGSQFFIVQNQNLDASYVEYFNSLRDQQDESIGQDESGKTVYVKDVMPIEVIDEYIKNGGTPHLDLCMNESGHTVFGQVVEGMDIVDAIAAVKVDENDKPLEAVLINSISFETVK